MKPCWLKLGKCLQVQNSTAFWCQTWCQKIYATQYWSVSARITWCHVWHHFLMPYLVSKSWQTLYAQLQQTSLHMTIDVSMYVTCSVQSKRKVYSVYGISCYSHSKGIGKFLWTEACSPSKQFFIGLIYCQFLHAPWEVVQSIFIFIFNHF